MNPIQSATSRPALTPAQSPDLANAAPNSTSFKDFLMNSMQQVNSAQQTADAAVEKLATGGDVSPAEVLTAVQKADIAFRMMMQIRNKIVQAYEDVQNVRV
jgi:flagellar hook-basal body complex protein FliE